MVSIQRAADGDTWLQVKGHWRPALIQETGQRTATVSCPTCGNVSSLSGHEIAADGTVTPSLGCPWKIGDLPCTFHDWIKLDGWKE